MDANEAVALLKERIKEHPSMAPVIECPGCGKFLAPFVAFKVNQSGRDAHWNSIPQAEITKLSYVCVACQHYEEHAK